MVTDKQRQYIADAPESSRGALEAAFSGTASPRAAIKAKCLSCVGFHRPSITGCTAVLCELYSYRPFQVKRKPRKSEAS